MPVTAVFLFFFFQNLFIYLFIYLFMYLWLRWVFVAACGLSLVAASRGYSSLRCAGFSLQWLLLLQSTGSRHVGSVVVARGLQREHGLQVHRLSSCGTWTQLLQGMWDLPRTGLEPVSPTLAGRFLTTAPPGKPTSIFLSVTSRSQIMGWNSKIETTWYVLSCTTV